MAISMHEASVGVFVPFLGNLAEILDKASTHAGQHKVEEAVLLRMRLFPNMYDLGQQVNEALRHAVIAGALLASLDPVELPNDSEFGGLKRRIEAAIDFLQHLPRDAIDAAAEREVSFTFRNGNKRVFTGRSLLLSFSVPQFFFHVTTAYDILRHAGVDLVKRDFLGTPRPT